MQKKTFGLVWILILAAGMAGMDSPPPAASREGGHIFATWEGFEADKCASIWLIVRFVDTDAEFRFFPRGTTIAEGTPFDTPDAELRRYHNMAAYESILRHYGIDDPVLARIGDIIHDIEVNTWQQKRFEETVVVLEEIQGIIDHNPDSRILIEKVLAYFDGLYDRLGKQKR